MSFLRKNSQFVTVLDLIKCLKLLKKKKQRLLPTFAPIAELPSNISTMTWPDFIKELRPLLSIVLAKMLGRTALGLTALLGVAHAGKDPRPRLLRIRTQFTARFCWTYDVVYLIFAKIHQIGSLPATHTWLVMLQMNNVISNLDRLVNIRLSVLLVMLTFYIAKLLYSTVLVVTVLYL